MWFLLGMRIVRQVQTSCVVCEPATLMCVKLRLVPCLLFAYGNACGVSDPLTSANGVACVLCQS